jgi:hypothetical protein
MEQSDKDLVRLCVLMHTKNEFQAMRHTARKQELRYSEALDIKRAMKQKVSLERKASAATNVDMKKIADIAGITETMSYSPRRILKQVISAAEDCTKREIEGFKVQAANIRIPHSRNTSNKLLKTRSTDLIILKREAHIANETAKLNIAKFTRENRKEMAAICKRNGWTIAMDRYNGYYVGVRKPTDSGDYKASFLVYNRDAIAVQAATQVLEDAMVSADME